MLNDLTLLQGLFLIIISGIILTGIFRIVFGIGNYFIDKANLYKAKLRVYKIEHKQYFNKWYD